MAVSSVVAGERKQADKSPAWHALEPAEVIRHWETNAERGLGSREAERRLEQWGPNAFAAARKAPWTQILARQFLSALIVILVLAAIISYAVGHVVDAVAILGIVAVNGALGFVQEWKAEEALEALRRMLAPRARVVRDAKEIEIEARAIVPGDIVLLETGDRIPADLRILEAAALHADESLLTGESVSVAKQAAPAGPDAGIAERSSMLWMGTNVTSGRARGVVVATGEMTEFGRIAHMTESLGEEKTPLEKRMAGLGQQLGIFAIGVAAIVAMGGWLMGKPALEMFLTGISLAVAVVPEGLPAVVTIALALGVNAMARRRALLRRLQAAETLGAASVICTDKTGTLTQNEMTVTAVWLPDAGWIEVSGTGYAPVGEYRSDGAPLGVKTQAALGDLLESALRANHASVYREEDGNWHRLGEPTEAALVVAAMKAGLAPETSGEAAAEFAFDSERKRMTVVLRNGAGTEAHVKGAPEILIERSTRLAEGSSAREFAPEDRARILATADRMAREGLRVLGVARRRLPAGLVLSAEAVENELTFLGLVGMMDPPRPEVPESVRHARAAGIKVIVATGDSPATATAVASRVGLPVARVLTAGDLAQLSDAELQAALREDVLFARITPEDKIRIVGALQKLGHVVCMTGDGVNDAPALKKADVGVAMGLRGTDVAKAASDLVLTDDNFASIVAAIEEGRRQWDNIRKFVRYLLSSNFGEVVAILVNTFLGGPLILLPAQILWINLVTDGATAVALAVEPAGKQILLQPPRPVREPILGRAGIFRVLALGGYLGFGTIWLFHHYLAGGGHRELAGTMAFCGLVMLEEMNVFNFRSLSEPIHAIGWASNRPLLAAWVATIGLQVASVYIPVLQRAMHTVPLSWQDWAAIAAFALPVFLVPETVKWVRWLRTSGA